MNINSYTNEDELREIKTTLDSLAALVKALGEQLNRVEAMMQKSLPTVSERLQAVSGSKSSVLANIPNIGSLTTKTK